MCKQTLHSHNGNRGTSVAINKNKNHIATVWLFIQLLSGSWNTYPSCSLDQTVVHLLRLCKIYIEERNMSPDIFVIIFGGRFGGRFWNFIKCLDPNTDSISLATPYCKFCSDKKFANHVKRFYDSSITAVKSTTYPDAVADCFLVDFHHRNRMSPDIFVVIFGGRFGGRFWNGNEKLHRRLIPNLSLPLESHILNWLCGTFMGLTIHWQLLTRAQSIVKLTRVVSNCVFLEAVLWCQIFLLSSLVADLGVVFKHHSFQEHSNEEPKKYRILDNGTIFDWYILSFWKYANSANE